MKSKLISVIVVFLILAETLLVLLSWLLSAMMTSGVRSLLSSEGIRWFFGQYTEMLQSPLLVCMLLLSLAGGALVRSGLLSRPVTYRQRLGLQLSLGLLVMFVSVVLLLTIVPHAILLSATGTLFPSPFSRALIPILAMGVLSISVTYGLAARTFTNLDDIIQSVSWGVSKAAPLFLLYVLAIQFFESLCFVFSLNFS